MQDAGYKHHTSHDNDNDGRLLVRSDHASAKTSRVLLCHHPPSHAFKCLFCG
jgi:hypothetical protein